MNACSAKNGSFFTILALGHTRHAVEQLVNIQLCEPAVALGVLVAQREPQVLPVGLQVQPHGIHHVVQRVEAPRALVQFPILVYQRIPMYICICMYVCICMYTFMICMYVCMY